MPQPPVIPIFDAEPVRPVPFCAQITFPGSRAAVPTVLDPLGGAADTLTAEFDVAFGITDENQLQAGDWPNATGVGHGTQPPHAVGPYLDAYAFITATVAGSTALITVEYAVDQTCVYHLITPGTVVPDLTSVNIAGLRITGRFVRVRLQNQDAVAGHTMQVEFGVYIRST